jgi:glycosyltransferase involved in cell wall biosynthesis
MYDFIYITNIPSFYKINLFNKISEKRKILVVFTKNFNKDRNEDFYKGDRNFDYVRLGNFWGIVKMLKIILILIQNTHNELILAGYDSKELWLAAFLSPKRKNSVVIESSIYESKIVGFKAFVKRIFIMRINKAYVSGKSQKDLALSLGFKGQLIITKGVGVFNTIKQPVYYPKNEVKNFIYVGRLSQEKNIEYLISTFNKMPELKLNIVGFGLLEKSLKGIANTNIFFHGAVPNSSLYKYYQQNDVFILPSLSEPWGLVVEEALNNGLPVIVSDRVGCADEIVDSSNGLVFKLSDPNGLKKAVTEIQKIDYYNSLRLNITKMDFEKITMSQIKCYL